MKKSRYDNRNFGYILSKDDRLETPIFVADTLKELADYLGISESGASRLLTREVAYRMKNHVKIERVQLYDYVYMIYDKDIYTPIYVASNIDDLVKKSGYSRGSIISTLYGNYYVKISPFNLSCIDLFDYDDNYAQYIRECLKVKQVTKSYQEYLEFTEDNNGSS